MYEAAMCTNKIQEDNRAVRFDNNIILMDTTTQQFLVKLSRLNMKCITFKNIYIAN